VGRIQEKLVAVMEEGYVDWAEVPHELIVKLGIDGLAPASGPIFGPADGNQEPVPHGDNAEREA